MKTDRTGLKVFLLSLFATLLPLWASAQVEIDGIWYNLMSETKEAEVTYKGSSYSEYDDEYSDSIAIPSKVTHGGMNYSVTSIGNDAFRYCSITVITLPASVTSIGDGAFASCNSLTAVHISDIAAWCNIKFSSSNSNPLSHAKNIYLNGELVTDLTIPQSVTSIGAYAFLGCSSLTAITIPASVTNIGNRSFDKCTSLKEIIFEDGNETLRLGFSYYNNLGRGDGLFIYSPLESVYVGRNLSYESGLRHGYSPFYKNTREATITLGEHITIISSYLFFGCKSLTSINIPESVTIIDDHAFSDCENLTSINIPKNVRNIEYNAFDGCSSLTSITIPESVTSIGSYAFSGCTSFTSINIPASVTSITEGVFSGCSSLTSITIPESVTSIGSYAFSGCTSLTSITIPKSVTSIEYATFRGCSSLTSITIPASVTFIGSSAFNGCSSFISIAIPASVMAIGYDAFDNCTALEKVIFEDGNENLKVGYRNIGSLFQDSPLESVYLGRNLSYQLGCSPFRNRKTLTSVVIGETVTIIGESAFSGCESLAAINIPESVTSIGDWAFSGCSSLTSITLPDGVTSIAEGTFYDCYGLTSVIIPDGVTNIGNDAFEYCENITAINIPASVKSIGEGAFRYCSNLISIALPEGVISIGKYTFKGCESLAAITIPNSVTSIGKEAFCNCESLAAITIPNSVTSIGEEAFYNCYSLASITIPDGVMTIAAEAFRYCYGLTSIALPKSLEKVNSQAFAGCAYLLDVYCYAEKVPTAEPDAFDGSYPANVTLHVPAIALEAYKTTAPWSSFGTILPIEGEQPDEPTEEGWSEWEAVGTAVTIKGKEDIMVGFEYWGEGSIEAWKEPITIDQRYDRAAPTKKQLRLNGIFNAKEIILDYDSSTGKIAAEMQSTGYATNKAMIEGQGMSNPYDEFMFSLSAGTYRAVTGVIDMSSAFISFNSMYGFRGGLTLQIEGVTPPTFTGQWDRKYVGREGGEATFTLTFEEPIVKYRALVLAPGESLTVSAVSALYAAKPETDLKYEETDSPTFAIACDKMGTYRVVFVPIGADGTAVLDYKVVSIVSYAEPAYETYEWEYIGESTVSEHVGSLLISNEELWEEGEDGLVNRYPFMTTSEGVKTYRRADNPNIIGLCNLYGENHPYSSMFTYVDQTQDWWVYIDVTNPKDVKLLTTPVGAVSTQVGYATFITQYSDAGAATLSDGVVTFPRGSVLLNNILNQDMQAAFDFKVILPTEEEPGNMVNQIELNQTSTTLIEGETMTLTATVTPDDADDTSVTWNSSDEAVATVDAQGKVTAVASGFAFITATANDGSGVSASCDVTVLGIFSITYLLDGEVYYYDELVQGTKIVLPKEPVKEGYTFSGWSEVPETMPAEDVIVEGTFVANKYLVTFRIGDEVIAADSLEYGAVIVVPDAPAKEGYTFSGWGEVPETMPAEDVVVEGTFAINKYLVTFRIGDEVVAADSLEYGAVIVVPDAPAKEGYTFNGWGEVPETMPAEDVIVEGTYTVNVYKVYYYVGEELVHTDEVAYGEVIPEYVYEPTAEGDVFMGWLGETYETMPAHDVTYTANIESSIHHSILNAHDAVIYDLSGRRVLNVENLTGVYIINGKRVLIK